ncbi:MAG: proline racemase family protein [Deltaproteobacteria bacterium]|nr:proline racemase family protein [Deltaproteobacteria bacterium]
MIRNSYRTPDHWQVITTLEAHTGGEPLRIFTDGLPEIKGRSILEKRNFFKENFDYLRTATMWEPRGHADMYGAILTEPVTPDGDLGVIFLHNEGYSTMCGHGIIAITTACFDCGWIKKSEGDSVLKIDAPAGRVEATAKMENGRVKSVSFLNVPSFLYKRDLKIEVPGVGGVVCDIAFGGAYYAFCQAEQIGIDLTPENHDRLIKAGRLIKNCVMASEKIEHPFEPDLGYLYGTIFIGPAEKEENHSRNVCIFAEGQVDRSPTGTGVSARAAIHTARDGLPLNEPITVESILGTTMTVETVKKLTFGPHDAVVPRVTGSAFITGENRLYIDPDDPLAAGFIFR